MVGDLASTAGLAGARVQTARRTAFKAVRTTTVAACVAPIAVPPLAEQVVL